MKVLVFTPNNSNRFEYIVDIIFRNILELTPIITTQRPYFKEYNGLKYEYEKVSNLLFEEVITSQKREELMSDPIALAFYTATCYEEYLPELERDAHQRPNFSQTLIGKSHWVKRPLVHVIAQKIAEQMEWEGAVKRKYTLLPTFDIDIAYASKGKSLPRFIAAFSRAIINVNGKKIKELLSALTNKNFKDPFDTFDFILQETQEKRGLEPIFFNLTSTFTKYDKNLSVNSLALKTLLKKLEDKTEVALHPSYYVLEKSLKKEKKALEKILDKTISKSRQHFLKVKFPDTFAALIEAGITDDYTLGFHDRAGFRTGMCIPFPWFNLTTNKVTGLQLHPLIFMDTYLLKNPTKEEEIIAELTNIAQQIKEHQGVMIPLWHNMLLTNEREQRLFIRMLSAFND